MMGHSCRRIPNVDHKAKPITVTVYMRAEIAAVSPDLTTFITCGMKLVTEHTDAR